MMIEKLREINAKLLEINPTSKKQQLVKKLLQNKDCFLKINITDAYSILEDLKIPDENKKEIYLELIKKEEE